MYLRPTLNSQGDRGRKLPPKAQYLSQISQRERDVMVALEQLEVVAGPWQTTRKKKHCLKKAEHIYWVGEDNCLV